jgi:hypothetical protein
VQASFWPAGARVRSEIDRRIFMRWLNLGVVSISEMG